MSGVSDLFGESGIARQFLIYGVGYEVARSLLQPLFVAISQDQWRHAVTTSSGGVHVALSPPVLADAVVKGWKTQDEAAQEAATSGTTPDRFKLMVDITGEPIPLELALEYWRRGFMPFTASSPGELSVVTAIRQSHMRSDWAKVIHQGHLTPPSIAAAVEAVVRNQVTRTAGIAMAWYAGLGVHDLSLPTDPAVADTERAFQILYDTAGRPPAPSQLAELVWRGVIGVHGRGATETTFEQGVYEGDLKDKWEAPLEALLVKYPALYEVRVLLEHGAISPEKAATYLEKQGYAADIATALSQDATSQAVITDRLLTEGNLKALYENATITRTQALTMLGDIGYPPTAANFIVASWQLDVSFKALSAAITKVGTYYIAHKITVTQAAENLRRLTVPETQIAVTIQAWTVDATSNVKLLTEAQIADAFAYTIMDQTTALSELEALGYTPYDAWVVLSVKAKGPLPGKPPQNVTGLA